MQNLKLRIFKISASWGRVAQDLTVIHFFLTLRLLSSFYVTSLMIAETILGFVLAQRRQISACRKNEEKVPFFLSSLLVVAFGLVVSNQNLHSFSSVYDTSQMIT